LFKIFTIGRNTHASVLAISQLRHQSATAKASPHMQQTLLQLINVMHQCHDSDVIFTSQVK